MYRDKDGWRVQWRGQGRRRSRKFDSKEAARRFELELELGVADATLNASASPTFSEYADRWLKEYCRLEKAESQWQADEKTIELHLEPRLGNVRLVHLRRFHLLDLKDELRVKLAKGKKHPLSPKSVNNILSLAKKIMATAVERELIGVNPFAGVKQVKLPPLRFRFWTEKERDTFILKAEGLDPEFTRLVLIACHTGLRLGELAALTRADLDFERRKIRVSKTWDVNLAKLIPMTKGKTDEDVPMNQAVYLALSPKRFLREGSDVFEKALFWNARKRLGRLAKAVEVPGIRFHDLRHTFASTLAMAGVDLMQIQQLMRHKSYHMTLRYAHLHPDHLSGATEILCTGTRLAHEGSEKPKKRGPRGT